MSDYFLMEVGAIKAIATSSSHFSPAAVIAEKKPNPCPVGSPGYRHGIEGIGPFADPCSSVFFLQLHPSLGMIFFDAGTIHDSRELALSWTQWLMGEEFKPDSPVKCSHFENKKLIAEFEDGSRAEVFGGDELLNEFAATLPGDTRWNGGL